MGLRVVQVLDAVLHLAQKDIGFAQGLGGLGLHQTAGGKLFQCAERGAGADFGKVPAARHLQQLHDELDLANAAARELDVVGALGPAGGAALGLFADLAVQLAQALEHAVIKVAAVNKGRDQRAQLHTRGDRLAFSNGILILAGVAMLLIVVTGASVTVLIQLYIVGVFVSFTLSQIGMIRHWNREIGQTEDAKAQSRMRRSRAINALGAVMSGTVLVVVLVTKFMEGARYAILAMAILFVIMLAIRRHYDRVAEELRTDDDEDTQVLPSNVHGIVLVSKVHKPTLRAIAYARASRPAFLEALTVDVDPDETSALLFSRSSPPQ